VERSPKWKVMAYLSPTARFDFAAHRAGNLNWAVEPYIAGDGEVFANPLSPNLRSFLYPSGLPISDRDLW
jgi:hypothetical protein